MRILDFKNVQNGVLFVKNDEVPELRDAKNVAVPDYTARLCLYHSM